MTQQTNFKIEIVNYGSGYGNIPDRLLETFCFETKKEAKEKIKQLILTLELVKHYKYVNYSKQIELQTNF